MKNTNKQISRCEKFEITNTHSAFIRGMGDNAVNPFEWPLAKFNFKKK